MKATRTKTKDMALIALFAIIIAICAWIYIPTAIPFTMQTFGVFLAVGTLGGKRGTAAICIYLLLGIIGIPVYARGGSGIGTILGNTGGYMIAWIFSGLVMWLMEVLFGKRTWVLALSMLLGLIVCYALGTAWYMVLYARANGAIGLWTALSWCVFPFIIPDLIKIALALTVQKRLAPFVQ